MPDQRVTNGWLKIIHGEYRTALLNRKYYGCRLEQYRFRNRCMEVAIAIGTTGSGVAGFALWQQGIGATAWAIISGLSIVLATIKPIIDLPKEIERYSKLSASYSLIFEAYRIIEQDLHAVGLTEAHLTKVTQLRSETSNLASDDDRNPALSLIKRFEDQVNKEIPSTSLWMPQR